jgi:putative ABC transport system permease protein
VIRRGAIIVSIGLIIGIGGAAILTHVLGSILYGVTGTDPATFASMAVLLALVALAACLIPEVAKYAGFATRQTQPTFQASKPP